VLILLLTVLMSFTACTKVGTESKNASFKENKNVSIEPVIEAVAEPSTELATEPVAEVVTEPVEDTVSVTEADMLDRKVNIGIAGKVFVATLANNMTANQFASMLPLTIKMDDVNGNEKYAVLPESIRKDSVEKIGTIYAGDLMCYGDSGLVLFYETFSTSYSYVPIGHIADIDGLIEALGSNAIDIQFTIQ